ncbi:hypothetical protein [uncultured Methanosphaera sp.]|uniref:hypothetical protein n=1 Tax=uncultured Methanosphaera sp. TaxID=262501 RepID=UPI000DC3481A|nr:hypothetical protein [uncultured Methanosphaera sp.]RAP44395.1 MAG: hypothetical protein BZ134_03565 [Methanosphaera sp. SHI1033]
MKKIFKLGIILCILIIFGLIIITIPNSDSIDADKNTLIISVCTGNMRGLEIGVSVYAGYNQVPLVLSDKTLPEQLNSWLPGYVKENNIKKIIVVGPMTTQQLIELYSMGVKVDHINDNSIASILTDIANNTPDKNNDTIIFTASNPIAGELGAYMKVPVFVTATNSSYNSSETLDKQYDNYIRTHNIQHIIIVGALPESLKNELYQYNIPVEEISGVTDVEVSMHVNDKLRSMGYLNNTTTAYYGFYGELPTIIPTIIKNNAMLIEDSSNNGNLANYLTDNNISNVVFTRNTESDYLQMEETDYISSSVVQEFEENNMSINYMTNNRTLDEATGLYDMKMITAEDMEHPTSKINDSFTGDITENVPPLLSILNYSNWHDSNNLSVEVNNMDSNYTVKWSTIHPYSWIKYNNSSYYATSNTGYTYNWIYNQDRWVVLYQYNNKTYYKVSWIKNDDNSWTELQAYENYTWRYNGTKWACYDNNSNMIYYIEKS